MQAVYLTFGLQRQLAGVARAAAWLGLWFALSARARHWAARAAQWQEEAGTAIWSDEFSGIHGVVWRLLLSYVLLQVAGLASAVAGKALALQFHHENHFERMQARRPCHLPPHARLLLGRHPGSNAGQRSNLVSADSACVRCPALCRAVAHPDH